MNASEEVFELWPEWLAEGAIKSDVARVFLQKYNVKRRGFETQRTDDWEVHSQTTSISMDLKNGGSCIISPSSPYRMAWDVTGVVILAYDIIFIPMMVFDPTPTAFSSVMEWLTLLFWTFDICVSFLTGYFQPNGKIVMKFKKIASLYLKTFFILDLVVVGADWFVLILDFVAGAINEGSGVGLARMGKIVRFVRILRTLRMLRLMKLRELLHRIERHLNSEYLSILGGLWTNIAGLMTINHMIACLWYLIGSNSGRPNWISANALEDEDWVLQYLVALHWALTQFTPASMAVVPKNITERAFNVCVLVFAMCVFSSFVSSITSAMTRLRTLKESVVAKQRELKAYLQDNEISSTLASRITRYVQISAEMRRKRADRPQLLDTLSVPLQISLQMELLGPGLIQNPYLRKYSTISSAAMSQLCFTATRQMQTCRGDQVFHFAAPCHDLIILTIGHFLYRRPKGVKGVPRSVAVPEGTTLCEMVLWTPWVHRGTTKAVSESEVTMLNSEKFREVTLSHPDAMRVSKEYATRFIEDINTANRSLGHVWDTPCSLMYGERSRTMGATTSFMESPLNDEFNAELQKELQMEMALMDWSSSSSSGGSDDFDQAPRRSIRISFSSTRAEIKSDSEFELGRHICQI